MSVPNIDWNTVWQLCHKKNSRHKYNKVAFWDKRAPEFTRSVKETDYILQFLEMMNPQPEWTVLDMGCAAGTLAIPLAKKVRSVTAVDPSPRMRELLQERCEKEGIENVRVVDGSWEQDWDELDIHPHDVFMASRSLLMDDLSASIAKAQDFTRQKVFLSTLVGNGPHDPRILSAVDRKFTPGLDYIIVLNVLRQMGIYADVSFTRNSSRKVYPDHESALNDVRWMVHDMSEDEEAKLREYLQETLLPVENGLTMPVSSPVRWAVLSWDKQTGSDTDMVEE
ncbi:class I SAM-dependent methyltransferase [Pseudodesulfovibrio sediminis]|uniref:SAM-dependent methyltransferase n=1 Tax=Pseudodesulfovibrio sediminis TaxID=2810563 RepID=A0ABM7PA79_9BACT|nr:class I SAM-dependent methyltransferase [Pseudodesulfovibrio sediminis]BCS89925.1 SAM-dependent methyltransferase [Pseudodesulfovibrio sediminis]